MKHFTGSFRTFENTQIISISVEKFDIGLNCAIILVQLEKEMKNE